MSFEALSQRNSSGKFSRFLTVFLAILLVFLLGVKTPQALFIPLALILWTFRSSFTKLIEKRSLFFGFIGSAWLLSLTIEIFAIWQNQTLPFGKRILFAQDPGQDLLIAVFFYFFCALIWYFLLRRYSFSPSQALMIQAIWSCVEQRGVVLKAALGAGPAGILLLLFVAGVYGTWIFFPVLFTRDKFMKKFPNRIRPKWQHFLLALAALYAFIWVLTLL